jgi:diaminopimelate decarboxylase
VNHFEYRDGILFAEDVSVIDIAKAVGTPFYCYSTAMWMHSSATR